MSGTDIPWGELQQLSFLEQSAWWQRALTPTAFELMSKLAAAQDRPMTDCVLVLIADNADLLRDLLRQRQGD